MASEASRNLEVIWLIEGLRPSHQTIADFRKNNSALKATHRDFLLLCKELSLFGGEEVTVDSSFFKADANKAGIYTEDKLNKQLAALEKKINDYQQALAEQDAADDKANKMRINNLPTNSNAYKKNKRRKKPYSNNSKQAKTNRFPLLMSMPDYSLSADKPSQATTRRLSSIANTN